MTQQSHCWAYTLRKPELKETRVPQCSLQHSVFIAALFIIARTWKQSRCPSADEWIRKLWYVYTMEYYSTIKKEYIWISSNKMDETRAYYTEWSKPERKTPIQYTNIYIYIYMYIYMEFRKMVKMTLYARQQKRHRCIKRTFGLLGRGRRWDD